MKEKQIYYYTRTGRSEAIAEKLAAQYQCKACKITDSQNYNGVIGFIKGGAKASKKDSTDIFYETVDSDKEIVLVFPLWAGTFPPAINSFLEKHEKSNIILVPTSLTSKLKNREGFRNVIDLIGKDIMHVEFDLDAQ